MIKTPEQNINENGFTLIEVLIAMVIFSIGILAVAQMQIRAIHGNSDAFAQTEATMWASNRAETLIALPYTDGALTAATYPVSGIPDTPDPTNKYALTWEITDLLIGNTKQIVITVAWTEKGKNKTLDFDFIKTTVL